MSGSSEVTLGNNDNDFATSGEAGRVVGDTLVPGVPLNSFVTKGDLVSSGRFNNSDLSEYKVNDFVQKKHITKGSVNIFVSLEKYDNVSRAYFKVNGVKITTEYFSKAVNYGESVTLECVITNPDTVFSGWHSDGQMLSSERIYQFQVFDTKSIVAKINYLEVDISEIEFFAKGGEKHIELTTNSPWRITYKE